MKIIRFDLNQPEKDVIGIIVDAELSAAVKERNLKTFDEIMEFYVDYQAANGKNPIEKEVCQDMKLVYEYHNEQQDSFGEIIFKVMMQDTEIMQKYKMVTSLRN